MTELQGLANPRYAKKMKVFFKTGPGEYGEGDLFMGVKNPVLRTLAKKNTFLSFSDIKRLVQSPFHEARLLGLLILLERYKLAEKEEKDSEKLAIYRFYYAHFPFINSWDLVDITCPHIVGKFLADKKKDVLLDWAKSQHLWTRRIAMVSNWWFIRRGDLSMVFKVARVLLRDEHDLIHKAVGWMLREAGKKDLKKTENFLRKHSQKMPRVMLRYAIERYPEKSRKKY